MGTRNNNGGVLKVGQYDLANGSAAVLSPLLSGTFLGNSNPFGFAPT
jgi:hypothetical protein